MKTIGILGPSGSYSEAAARKYFPKSNITFFKKLTDVLDAVQVGTIEQALVPIKNSIYGDVVEVMNWLKKNKVHIIGTFDFKINHVLLGLPNHLICPRKIYSHPQALGQCSNYLKEKYPKTLLIKTPSTSAAVEKIKGEKIKDSFAIGSELVAKRNNLRVIAKNIQNEKLNITSFVLLKKSE